VGVFGQRSLPSGGIDRTRGSRGGSCSKGLPACPAAARSGLGQGGGHASAQTGAAGGRPATAAAAAAAAAIRQQPDVRIDDVGAGKARRRNSCRLIIARPGGQSRAGQPRNDVRDGIPDVRAVVAGRGTAGIASPERPHIGQSAMRNAT